MGLFGRTPEKNPKELIDDWSRKIRKEMRVIDRQIRVVQKTLIDNLHMEDKPQRIVAERAGCSECRIKVYSWKVDWKGKVPPDIQREQEKVKRSIKDAAKKGQKDVCVVLAKEMIQSKRAITKLYASKAQMNSVLLSMKNQLAVVKVAGAMQKSTEVMKAMQNLLKIPEIQATMRDLSKEMMKAGIIEEMLEDTFESMEDGEEMEEAAEEEVDKILFEITAGALGKAPSKVTDALPEMEPPGAAAASDDESEEDIEEMQSRLAALRS